MITLGVDTSTEFLTVSVISGNKVLSDYNAIGRLSHSALLVPTIQKALRKARKKLKDVDLFAVGMGPGSFTGLRIGVTAMRAFSIALNKPIIGVPTLDAIAYNALELYSGHRSLHNGGLTPIPILDAKKSQVYACIYRIDGDRLVRNSDYLLEPVERLMKRLEGDVLFLGDGIAIYKDKLMAEKTIKAKFIEDNRWFPKASVIAKLGLEMFKSGKRDDPYDLEPLYLYARDCNVMGRPRPS
ncbi:MAG: tRNA (adenosine(37)-N6)-threonylcarbamoyltransferase complex dimerization subunit type 1 TsaB [Candidatus Omnitrophica bacterium]|nr:tRNA (adenosine(37)-N6)-threonylcarbamoyltransferase complex dimerization subunit type 1 TsaB [Candidatus Omnitrophota bacterium]